MSHQVGGRALRLGVFLAMRVRFFLKKVKMVCCLPIYRPLPFGISKVDGSVRRFIANPLICPKALSTIICGGV
jgi:hypothetical protein